MNLRTRPASSLLSALLLLAATTSLRAGDTTTTSTAVTTPDTRYGLFGLMDHRSSYGQDVFPEPFIVDDTDRELGEFRLDWFHSKAGSARSDVGTVEFEKGFGLVTFEIEAPYERDSSPDGVVQGMANIDLGVRCPVYQYVSPGGFFDTTFGVAMEVGIPTTSHLSKNAEWVPKVFNDLRIGSRITLQSIAGYSILSGPGEDSGLHVFEYGFVLGCTFQHKELPIPGVQQFIPVFEVSGEKQLNHDSAANSIIANAGFRVNLNAIGPVQPRLGVGYVFPMNEVARADIHHGIYTSFVFEF
ncbi:MAG: hypothetical protein P4L99_20370 [Chthoniobacter sp.]|nr:hypothetical protein [Chthoniobacter sp.]